MVSTWATDQRLVLGPLKMMKNKHEITAIPKLLKVLALTGCIVTIDAMGCQKEIVKLISEREADYIILLPLGLTHCTNVYLDTLVIAGLIPCQLPVKT